MKRDGKEAGPRLVALPDHEPDIFQIYLRWIYFHQINVKRVYADDIEWIQNLLIRRIRTYILSDILQHRDFKGALIDTIAELIMQS